MLKQHITRIVYDFCVFESVIDEKISNKKERKNRPNSAILKHIFGVTGCSKSLGIERFRNYLSL